MFQPRPLSFKFTFLNISCLSLTSHFSLLTSSLRQLRTSYLPQSLPSIKLSFLTITKHPRSQSPTSPSPSNPISSLIMPFKWDDAAKFQVLMLAIKEADFKPSAQVFAEIAAKLGGGLNGNAVSYDLLSSTNIPLCLT